MKTRKLRVLKLMLLFTIFLSDNSKIFYCNSTLLDVADPQDKGEWISGVEFPSLRKLPIVQREQEGRWGGSDKAKAEATDNSVLLTAAKEKKNLRLVDIIWTDCKGTQDSEAEVSGDLGKRTYTPDYSVEIRMMMVMVMEETILTLLGYVNSNLHPNFSCQYFPLDIWKVSFFLGCASLNLS